ncbi:MAG: hypothetical protein WCT44_04000 [Candidatus Paceibacterota bacterium]
MSRTRLIQEIEKEIERLNNKIDLRIIKGLSYYKEARRHKFLRTQLSNLTREEVPASAVSKARFVVKRNWFDKAGSLVTMFLF